MIDSVARSCSLKIVKQAAMTLVAYMDYCERFVLHLFSKRLSGLTGLRRCICLPDDADDDTDDDDADVGDLLMLEI